MNNPFQQPDPEPATWVQQAACRDHAPSRDWWFPEHGETHLAKRAAAICQGCPVQADCLDYALTNNERHGIWAGVNFGKPKPRREARLLRPAG